MSLILINFMHKAVVIFARYFFWVYFLCPNPVLVLMPPPGVRAHFFSIDIDLTRDLFKNPRRPGTDLRVIPSFSYVGSTR